VACALAGAPALTRSGRGEWVRTGVGGCALAKEHVRRQSERQGATHSAEQDRQPRHAANYEIGDRRAEITERQSRTEKGDYKRAHP
jgi:hypothetical protein